MFGLFQSQVDKMLKEARELWIHDWQTALGEFDDAAEYAKYRSPKEIKKAFLEAARHYRYACDRDLSRASAFRESADAYERHANN